MRPLEAGMQTEAEGRYSKQKGQPEQYEEAVSQKAFFWRQLQKLLESKVHCRERVKTVCQKNCFQPGGPSTLSLDIPYPKQWRVQSRPYRQLLRGDNITVSLVFHIFPYTFALSLNSGIFLNMYQQVELIKKQHVISALTSLICLLSPMVSMGS